MNAERLRQVEELYHAAREDRAVLDKADPELRREVESLLAQDPSGALFLEPPAAARGVAAAFGEAGERAVTVGGANTRAMIGQRFGSYEIVARLGAGGMDI